MTTTHKFTLTGLGEAPFRFLGVSENAFRNADGTTRAGGTCDHCGTCIRWEFRIRSADGVKSKVGSDCIMKAGDRGLINAAKAEQNRRKREAAGAKREAAWQAKLDAQRERNGGLTDYEAREQAAAQSEADRKVAIQPAIDILGPLADRLEDYRGGFRDSVSASLRQGSLPSERGAEIISDILGKQQGRSNTSAYAEERQRVLDTLEAAAVIIDAAN